jgi:hypothetical protein
LAAKYRTVKFIKVVSSSLTDIEFDLVALPILLVYKGGEVVQSLMRVTDDIDGWNRTGRCELEDFEEFLKKRGVLNEDEEGGSAENEIPSNLRRAEQKEVAGDE